MKSDPSLKRIADALEALVAIKETEPYQVDAVITDFQMDYFRYKREVEPENPNPDGAIVTLSFLTQYKDTHQLEIKVGIHDALTRTERLRKDRLMAEIAEATGVIGLNEKRLLDQKVALEIRGGKITAVLVHSQERLKRETEAIGRYHASSNFNENGWPK